MHFRAQGIPRLINAMCDNLLLTSFAMETKIATREMLDEVVADMRLEHAGDRQFRTAPEYPEHPKRHSPIRLHATEQ